jgi:hypothetical protein
MWRATNQQEQLLEISGTGDRLYGRDLDPRPKTELTHRTSPSRSRKLVESVVRNRVSWVLLAPSPQISDEPNRQGSRVVCLRGRQPSSDSAARSGSGSVCCCSRVCRSTNSRGDAGGLRGTRPVFKASISSCRRCARSRRACSSLAIFLSPYLFLVVCVLPFLSVAICWRQSAAFELADSLVSSPTATAALSVGLLGRSP